VPKEIVHDVELKVPSPVAGPEKVTMPEGGADFGKPSVSRTVAVHVVGVPAANAVGEQLTRAEELRTYCWPWKGMSCV
jgi:hypothetical protein